MNYNYCLFIVQDEIKHVIYKNSILKTLRFFLLQIFDDNNTQGQCTLFFFLSYMMLDLYNDLYFQQ